MKLIIVKSTNTLFKSQQALVNFCSLNPKPDKNEDFKVFYFNILAAKGHKSAFFWGGGGEVGWGGDKE